MIRRLTIVLLLFLFILSSTSFAENWVNLGEDESQIKEIWLDLDSILPVAKETKEGEMALIPFTYGSIYREEFKGSGGFAVVFSEVSDVKARKRKSVSDQEAIWRSDPFGTDGIYFYAYLIKNYEEIQKRQPIVLAESLLLTSNEPNWKIDLEGWQQVYQIPRLGKAWMQTKSARLSSLEEEGLPRVRVLVRYQMEGETTFIYAYEEYNPETRLKRVLRVWDGKQKSFLFRRPVMYRVKVGSPEASIATAAYSPFILDPTLVGTRPFFTEGDNGAYRAGFFEEWLKFDKK